MLTRVEHSNLHYMEVRCQQSYKKTVMVRRIISMRSVMTVNLHVFPTGGCSGCLLR